MHARAGRTPRRRAARAATSGTRSPLPDGVLGDDDADAGLVGQPVEHADDPRRAPRRRARPAARRRAAAPAARRSPRRSRPGTPPRPRASTTSRSSRCAMPSRSAISATRAAHDHRSDARGSPARSRAPRRRWRRRTTAAPTARRRRRIPAVSRGGTAAAIDARRPRSSPSCSPSSTCWNSPLSACSRVDLPEPVAPVTSVRVPGATVRGRRPRGSTGRRSRATHPGSPPDARTTGSARRAAANPRTSIDAPSAIGALDGLLEHRDDQRRRAALAAQLARDPHPAHRVQQRRERAPSATTSARDTVRTGPRTAPRVEQRAQVDDDARAARTRARARRTAARSARRSRRRRVVIVAEQRDVLERAAQPDARQIEQIRMPPPPAPPNTTR